MSKKIILHLCAKSGSDSRYFQLDPNYEVRIIDEKIGVENIKGSAEIYGVIANPVCTEMSTVKGFHKENDIEKGMILVNHCLRIVDECKELKFWSLENPFNGRLKDILGYPDYVYQPWEFGSAYTKKTALWGNFNKPEKLYTKFEDVPKNPNLYVRPGRKTPSLAFLHKSALEFLPEFWWARDFIQNDSDLRSMCSDGFAKQFYLYNQ